MVQRSSNNRLFFQKITQPLRNSISDKTTKFLKISNSEIEIVTFCLKKLLHVCRCLKGILNIQLYQISQLSDLDQLFKIFGTGVKIYFRKQSKQFGIDGVSAIQGMGQATKMDKFF